MNNKLAIKLSQVASLTSLCAIFCIPIKLSLTYIFLFISFFSLIYLKPFNDLKKDFLSLSNLNLLITFTIISILSSLFGFSPSKSIVELLKLLGLIFIASSVFTHSFKIRGAKESLLILILAQSITSAYSIIEFSLENLPKVFLGAVSESGQLAILVPFLIILLFNTEFKSKDKSILKSFDFIFLAFFLCSFALLVNLKRGPLFGVIISSLLFFLTIKKKFIIPFLVIIILAIVLIKPLGSRLSSSLEHFNIAGGRNVMWSMGSDLLTRYPLGIGYGNSKVIQEYAKEIPPEHKHLHNNYLNIAVETGILGLLLFTAWLLNNIKNCFNLYSKTKNFLYLASCCSIISWSIAGFVEYSFGDAEVFLLLIFIISFINLIEYKKEAT